jgi:hypothetical protein
LKSLFYKLAFIFVAVLIWFELVFGIVLPRKVAKSRDSYIVRWEKLYTERTNAGIVCIGSSRIHRHCNPEIIFGITHLSTEIIAEPGAKIDVFIKLYDDYLKLNKRPKILVVGIDLTGLDSMIFLPSPEQFFPPINSSDYISDMSEFNFIKYHKALGYFYFKELYMDILEDPILEQHTNGFLVRDEKWNNSLENFIGKYPHGYTFQVFPPTLEKIFQFMEREKKAGVQCVGLIAPEYYEVWQYENNRSVVCGQINKYAEKTGIPVWNFSDSSYKPCFNKELFYNSQHLNKEGSTIFSRDLSDSILKYCSLGN